MEKEQPEEEEEVHGLEGAPFLTRAAYEKELSRGTAGQFVVATNNKIINSSN